MKNKNIKKTKKLIRSVIFVGMLALSTFITGCSLLPGADGKNGSNWYTGTDVVDFVDFGANGDFFFDSDDEVLYQKISGVWTEISNLKQYEGLTQTVDITPDGYWIINGNKTNFTAVSTPYIHQNTWWVNGKDTGVSAIGQEGKSAFDLYQEQNPNFDGTISDWFNLLREKGEQGDPGSPGSTWLTGGAEPQNGDGNNGDWYLNTTNLNVYKKSDGVWEVVANIKGPDGEDGHNRKSDVIQGIANTPMFLGQKGLNISSINLSDEMQKTTIYGTNRLDLNKVDFSLSRSQHKVTEENNGITLECLTEMSSSANVQAFYEYKAEFTGTLWVSCDAELAQLANGGYGDVHDVGMKIYIKKSNNAEYVEQYLCRGEGRLAESVEVEKGDTVKVAFYIRIGSTAINKINYKNIMIQYNTLTDYVPYLDNVCNYNSDEEYQGLSNLDFTTGCIIESEGDFTVKYSYIDTEKKKTLKVVNFGDSITGIATNGVSYSSIIDRTSNIETYNVGFSGTTWTDHGSEKNTPFSMNRLVDAICSEGEFKFKEQDAQVAKCDKTYIERLETLKKVDFSEVDYVTIFYGVNDWNNGRPLESAEGSNENNKQQTYVKDAIEYSITKLKAKYPDLKFIVITPYWCTFKDTNSDVVPNKSGVLLSEYADYIEKTANSLGVEKVLNLYQMFDFINFETYSNYMYDGVHPSNNLHQVLAQVIIRTINELKASKA